MDYRLTGEIVEQVCVKHLRDSMRAVVAFLNHHVAWVLMIGPHDRSSETNVYTRLYEAAGISPPTQKRTKPACCDPGGANPTTDQAVFDQLVDGLSTIEREARGRPR